MTRRNQIGIIYNEPLPAGEPFWESSRDVLIQVEAIETALIDLEHSPVRLPFGRDLEQFIVDLKKKNIWAAFNLCESVNEDPSYVGHPAAVLELLGIPFTGSSAMALMITTDKLLSKQLLEASRISTPAYRLFERHRPFEPAGLNFPVILKPRFQDASIGIEQDSIFTDPRSLVAGAAEFYERFGPILVEEFIPGREFNIALCGDPEPRVLPIAEISFVDFPAELYQIVGYKAKWDSSSFEYQHTPRSFAHGLDAPMVQALQATALECFRLFRLRDYGRIDIRLDERNRIQVLEPNANPCLSPDAGFAAAAGEEGLTYTAMVAELVEMLHRRTTAP